jgi:outer membrane lipoprotein-sorting protein
MKSLKRILLLVAILTGASSAYAQTADQIIAKHIDAIGGKDKLNTITSVHMESTVEAMGISGPSTTTILNGKGFRNESEFNGQKVVTVYTDKGGWTINPFAGSTDPQALSDEQYKASEDDIYIEPFYKYAERGSKVELLGQEKLGDINAYKIKLTNKDNSAATYYLDPSTYQIIQITGTTNMMGQDMDVKTTCSDYTKTDYGFVVPKTIQVNIGDQFTMTTKLDKFEVNQPVDASIFEMKK